MKMFKFQVYHEGSYIGSSLVQFCCIPPTRYELVYRDVLKMPDTAFLEIHILVECEVCT